MNIAIEASRLSKRYRRQWALDECSFALPEGRVAALVGANGAGKSTLLNIAAGLLRPTGGTLRLLGIDVAKRSELLPRVGFVAQDAPLYRGFTVNETFELGRHLNRTFDMPFAFDRMRQLGIGLGKKVGQLSGGQRAHVALVLAIARRPDLLLLDEPLASLDPLARRGFLSLLMEEAASRPMTIVLSSHLIGDLERACDHVLVLAEGRVRVAGDIDELVATHLLLRGAAAAPPPPEGCVVHQETTGREATYLVRTRGGPPPPGWDGTRLSLEELVLAYMERPALRALNGLTPVAVEV